MRAQQAQVIMHSEATAIITATISTDAMGLVRHCSVTGRSTCPAVASSRWWTGSSACLSGEFLLHSGSDAEHAARQYPAITESVRVVPITRATHQCKTTTSMSSRELALNFCTPLEALRADDSTPHQSYDTRVGLNHLRFASLHTHSAPNQGVTQTFLLTVSCP